MRITIFLVLALILALIITVFAVQNNIPINITFLAWTLDGSLALILMITFAFGILIGLLISAPAWIKRVRQSAELKKNIRGLEKDLETARMTAATLSRDQIEERPVAEAALAEQEEEGALE